MMNKTLNLIAYISFSAICLSIGIIFAKVYPYYKQLAFDAVPPVDTPNIKEGIAFKDCSNGGHTFVYIDKSGNLQVIICKNDPDRERLLKSLEEVEKP